MPVLARPASKVKVCSHPPQTLTVRDWAWQGLRPHPDKIAETNSLSSVPLPKLPYKMSLPGHVLLGMLP